MDTLLEIILGLYRTAHEVSVDEFQARALSLLRTVLPFDSAMWHTVSNSDNGLRYSASMLYEHPEPGLVESIDVNRRHPTVVDKIFSQPGRAHRFHAFATYPRPDQADVRDYIRRYGHQNALLIVDSAKPCSIGETLPLYRVDDDNHFSERDQRLLEMLFPHMVESLAISRQLAFGRIPGKAASTIAGSRALAWPNGLLMTSGDRFAQLLRRQWPDWSESWLPRELVQMLARSCGAVRIVDGSVTISFQRVDGLIFLGARECDRTAVLSRREREIARLFANGSSHKAIAGELKISSTTVRNVLQRSYRKLQITDRTALVRVFGRT